MSIRFAALGMDHPHIYEQTDLLIAAGAELISYYDADPRALGAFGQRYPQAHAARTPAEIYEDERIHLITSAAVPAERAAIGIAAMQHGKDCFMDKPGATTLEQLAQLQRVQAATQRLYVVYFSERLGSRATVQAAAWVQAGALGRIVSVTGMGPHKLGHVARPAWFYDPARSGGILNFLASHQIDQFLFFTGSTTAEIVAAQCMNRHHPDYPDFEDYGDVLLRTADAVGYFRVDWLTPPALPTWGDTRLFLVGTEGTLEIRKNIDIGGRSGGDHLLLVNAAGTTYSNAAAGALPFGRQLIADIEQRTAHALPQAHVWRVSELAIRAQLSAQGHRS